MQFLSLWARTCLTLAIVMTTAWSQPIGAQPIGEQSEDFQRLDLKPEAEAKSRSQISELIEQLGDPRYAERRYAERALQRLGLVAFDELLKATEHLDPEIEATSKRLLAEATKEWHRATDPDLVHRNLIRYANRSQNDRLLTIEILRQLPDYQGIEALCRLARYETSEQVSKAAAAALFQNPSDSESPLVEEHRERIRLSLDKLREQAGPTRRAAIVWLEQLAYGTSKAGDWLTFAEQESRLIEKNASDTNQQIIERLLWIAFNRARLNTDENLMIDIVERLIQLEESSLVDILTSVSKRLNEPELQETLFKLLESYEARLQDRRGLYLRAAIALARGQANDAEALAQEAFAIPSGGDTSKFFARTSSQYRQKALLLGERILMAEMLDQEGRGNPTFRAWACRELEAASKQLDPLSVSVAYARWKLGEYRNDSEQYRLAAESLSELVEYITASSDLSRHYNKLSQQATWLPLPDLRTLSSQSLLYESQANQREGDLGQAEKSLESSFNADPTNADVLIAMYLLEDRSLAFMTKVRDRILSSCRRLEVEIAQDPTSPTAYNHWAWLVANTEGDYAKAVRYSERSLELSPNNAGYLDTLGRCLFSVGRIDEAIQAQQKAVEQMPSMLVMQRQLALFREAKNQP